MPILSNFQAIVDFENFSLSRGKNINNPKNDNREEVVGFEDMRVQKTMLIKRRQSQFDWNGPRLELDNKLTLIVDQSTTVVWYISALSLQMSKRLIISTITKSSCKPLNSKI